VSQKLVLWGSPASQPVRAVYWLLLMKERPFHLNLVNVGKMGVPGPVAAVNPSGQVPTLQDGDVAVYEMPAILIYLCEKFGWTDLLPGDDLVRRTRVHQYLHFHHNWTRRASQALMSPHVVVAFREVALARGKTQVVAFADDPGKLEAGRKVVRGVADLIERGCFQDGDFLCGPGVTIADIACYEELAQLTWANLFSFAEFPRLSKWLGEMAKLPFHDAAHCYNLDLGDIATRPITMSRLMHAIDAGVAEVTAHNVTVQAYD
jgi:glutathione S-transferase